MSRKLKEQGTTVYILSTESFDKALNKFKRKVKLSNKLLDLKKHSAYVKPSVKMRRRKLLGKLKLYYRQKQLNETVNYN